MEISKYLDKLYDFFGLNDVAKDNKETYNTENQFSKKKYNDSKSNIVSIKRNNETKLIFHKPDSYNDVKEIVDDLKERKPIILNLEDVEKRQAKRFIDFISGAVYGINGNIQKVGCSVFLFTPSNINIDGKKINDEIIKNSFVSK